MAKKILIIEDMYDHYMRFMKIADSYDVVVYPQPSDFNRFRKLLSQFAKHNDPKDLSVIEQDVLDFAPDLILLDVCLDYDHQDTDETGLLLKQEIFDKSLRDSELYYMTRGARLTVNQHNHIDKKAPQGLESELKEKIFRKLDIGQRRKEESSVKTVDNGSTLSNQALIDNYVVDPVNDPPSSLQKIGVLHLHKILPWMQFVVDVVIIYIFYIFLALLAIMGPVLIVKGAIKNHFDLIHVAEYTFIAFLPFLIVFGLFTLYLQSLQPFVTGAEVRASDFEKASKLMMLTKKLFVSSLISYLFTKIIELINPEPVKSEVEHLLPETFPALTQVYLLGGCIIILIAYYIYLSSHKDHLVKATH